MLNICLCDDDTNVLNYYSNKINELAYNSGYVCIVETFKSGESLIFDIEDNPNRFNIIIIDIIMKNINGIETAKILRKYGYNGIIIFLTSSQEFALDSFKVNPLNYILKNDRDNRFDNIFLKAAEEVYKISNKNIFVFSKAQSKLFNIDTILYMESLNKKVILHKVSGELETINCVFKDVYEKIKDHGFVRCHKSYIINVRYLSAFNKLECRLQRDVIVPIGRKYSKDFKRIILENEFDNIMI